MSDYVDGYKTHMANIATPIIQYYGIKRSWSLDAHMVALSITCGLSSLCRMMARKPGPLAPDV